MQTRTPTRAPRRPGASQRGWRRRRRRSPSWRRGFHSLRPHKQWELLRDWQVRHGRRSPRLCQPTPSLSRAALQARPALSTRGPPSARSHLWRLLVLLRPFPRWLPRRRRCFGRPPEEALLRCRPCSCSLRSTHPRAPERRPAPRFLHHCRHRAAAEPTNGTGTGIGAGRLHRLGAGLRSPRRRTAPVSEEDGVWSPTTASTTRFSTRGTPC
mmetsp:Transcript_50818/g.164375  ORF Transcript_50818/g.164375 Transcript_50818/m.164375 type:complete len:212 (-) Transcript_50818:951-1586(-)